MKSRVALEPGSDLWMLMGGIVVDDQMQIEPGRGFAFDLAQERLGCFSAYRFLYERLLGPNARPWLPAAFCGAAALPQIRPFTRKALLQSISEAAATAPGWSDAAPSFYPEWVEKEAA